MTITKSITSYKQELRAINGFSNSTITSYVNAVKSLSGFTANTDITLITNKTLKDWLIDLREQGVSQNSTNTYVVAIRRYIRYINQYGAMVDMDAIKPPKRKEVRVDYIGSFEVKLMIESRSDIRDQAIIATLFTTGVRNFELCNLKKDDLRSGQIQVLGKGSKMRTVFIEPYSERLIYKYLITRGDTSPYLFVSKKQPTQLTPSGVRKILRQAREDTGVQATPHTLRHSFASNLVKNDMNTRHIQHLLGHSKLETTQRYTHVQPVDIRNSYRGRQDSFFE